MDTDQSDSVRCRHGSLVVDDWNATQLAILRERQHHGDEVGDRDVTQVEPLSELRRKEV